MVNPIHGLRKNDPADGSGDEEEADGQMRDAETWIKLNRNMLEWRWYKDQNTKALFIHLLIKASIKNQDYRDVSVRRGELVTSLATLANETGLSIQNVRTALGHLKSTGC